MNELMQQIFSGEPVDVKIHFHMGNGGLNMTVVDPETDTVVESFVVPPQMLQMVAMMGM